MTEIRNTRRSLLAAVIMAPPAAMASSTAIQAHSARRAWAKAAQRYERAKAAQEAASAAHDRLYPANRPEYPDELRIPTVYKGYRPDEQDIRKHFPPEQHARKLALLAAWWAEHDKWCEAMLPEGHLAEVLDRTDRELCEAEKALILTPAPDLAAVALKFRIVCSWLFQQDGYDPLFDPADPEWRRVAEVTGRVQERAMVGLHADLLRLSGTR
jgi:hypothetical protein